ncbi:MAG: alpha-amylase family glycosyl hydrolase [Candidatus Manganitrophus sp.]|nr:alpha-amylase family glycosyl hydrolase [Candidatus Manganitrophus sp.]
MAQRAQRSRLSAPLSIYEMHLGSWRRVPEEGNRPMTYREMARPLAEYLREMRFTHVEFLPITEHPFYGSWGYQTTGYFAPTRRYGTPQDLMYLIDTLHQNGIGVILDWVPSHFPTDQHGLSYFDGTHLYEHADSRKGFHPDWSSAIFNYGRNEVKSVPPLQRAFLAREVCHVDGLRVDAVASMLYLDYARAPGDWFPNRHGGKENLEAIALLRELNEAGVRPLSRRPDHGRGIHRLADGLAAHLRGRTGLQHEVEHGLDERHPRLHVRRPGAPPLPPRPSDLRPALRLQRELHPAPVPRRGGARQALAARQDAGGRLAALRQPAPAVRLQVHPSREASCCSWAASSPRGRSGATIRASTGRCCSLPRISS